MGWQAPGSVWLKHMVLQDKVFGIGPVVGNFVGIVISHYIGLAISATGRIIRVYTASPAFFSLSDEAIHLAVIDVGRGVGCTVWPSVIEVLCVVIWFDALTCFGIIDAHCGDTVLHGDTIRTGIGSEVGIERAILLHNDDDMLDFVNTWCAAQG